MAEPSYWEKFVYALGLNPYDPPPNFDQSWAIASFVHGAIANWLIYKDLSVSPPKSWLKSGEWFDSTYSEWSNVDIYAGGVLDKTEGKAEQYNKNLQNLFWENGLNGARKHEYIKTPSFFLKMGYSNVRQYFSWGAFVLAWAASINKDKSLLNMANDYLKNAITRPQDIDADLFRSPSSTDENRMEEFANKVEDIVKVKFATEIKPYLYGDNLSGVRAFCQQMNEDAKDTIMLAVQTKGFKRDESMDWGKIGLTVVLGLGLFSYLKR
jgi:hypothetical protein